MLSIYDILSTKESLRNKPIIPERELLIATLDRAVLDYYGSNCEMRRSAGEWLFDDSEADHIFSFNWICEHLGIEPKAVQKRIQNLSIPTTISQAHRWLRSKVQSRDGFPQEDTRQAA